MIPNRLWIFFSVLIVVFCNSHASAQTWDSFEFVKADWHLAGISEATSDWKSACQYYHKIIDESRPMPLDVREWYRGTAYYGLARCESRLGASAAEVRLELSRAFSHHFWNFELAALDSEVFERCGRAWLDSNRQYWSGVLNEERPLWGVQPAFFFYPSNYDSTAKYPLIVTLHGGNANYESFAERWRTEANELHAVIAVPAGCIRESQITNSWGSDMDQVYKSVTELLKDISARHLADMSHVYLAGFSQGAQASIELTLLHPDVFRGAIAMSGFVDCSISDSVLRIAKNRNVRIYAISGQLESPTFHAELDTIRAHAVEKGIPFELKRFEGMTHEVPLDFHSQIADAWTWVREPVEAERIKGK